MQSASAALARHSRKTLVDPRKAGYTCGMSAVSDALNEPLYASSTLCELAGASFRQLDYWCRNDTLPAARRARGQGSQRAFTRDQIVVARVLRHLSELGATAPVLRVVARDLLFSRREWATFIVVTPDARVRHVHSMGDLVGGWVVNLQACEIRVDLQLQTQLVG